MNIIDTGIQDLKVLEPRIFEDDRGYFFESYNHQVLESELNTVFVQDNEAKSGYGTIRGLHYQVGPTAQAKLVRVVHGEVLDVAVDIRPESDTYGRVFSIRLSADNKKQLFVPRGFAHGYSVLSETAVFVYKCDNYYDRSAEGGILFKDEQLKIDWMVDVEKALVSEKDQQQAIFGEHRTYTSH